jgi:hypothetical protein
MAAPTDLTTLALPELGQVLVVETTGRGPINGHGERVLLLEDPTLTTTPAVQTIVGWEDRGYSPAIMRVQREHLHYYGERMHIPPLYAGLIMRFALDHTRAHPELANNLYLVCLDDICSRYVRLRNARDNMTIKESMAIDLQEMMATAIAERMDAHTAITLRVFNHWVIRAGGEVPSIEKYAYGRVVEKPFNRLVDRLCSDPGEDTERVIEIAFRFERYETGRQADNWTVKPVTVEEALGHEA